MKHRCPIPALAAFILALFASGQTLAEANPRAQVRQADLAFADALARGDKAAFAEFIAPDARFFGGPDAHVGREEILEAWSRYFEENGPRLSWEPAKVEVNEQRGLATTTGPYSLTIPASEEELERTLYGRYFSVWTKTASGNWVVIFDTGTPPGEPKSDQAKSGG